ncbi:MAG: DUF5946 family protein [Treponema sp.]|jgi:hypothetical protein|nr:DUF5946 family protein [Treponema sp.]
MYFRCKQCGGIFSLNETCKDRFNITQTKEFENNEYFIVHHLSVPSYMLQHNNYSTKGWLLARELLFQFIYNNLTPDQARKQNRHILDNGNRKWNLNNTQKLTEVERIKWSFTLWNVRYNVAEEYCEDIKHWARSIFEDTKEIVKRINWIKIV